MPKICGEVKLWVGPVGGGVHTYATKYVYADGSPSEVKTNWYKSRMVFPSIRIGETSLDGAYVANDQLGHEIAESLAAANRSSASSLLRAIAAVPLSSAEQNRFGNEVDGERLDPRSRPFRHRCPSMGGPTPAQPAACVLSTNGGVCQSRPSRVVDRGMGVSSL